MKKLLIYLLTLVIPTMLFSQYYKISGIINSYSKLTGIISDKTEIVVSDINELGIDVGDKILIIQMKGAEISKNNDSSFGQITDIGNCGNYEFATVKEFSGSKIILTQALCNEYDLDGFVQVIRVPVYNNAIVENTLTCKNWDGYTGGVLALEVNGSLKLDALIDVSAKGFKGGKLANTTWVCDQKGYYYPNNSYEGAMKGEGIVDLSYVFLNGRGAAANGGGGGNSTNAGGAGGSNYSAGGKGGYQFFDGCETADLGGLGGVRLKDYYNNKIFLGGGGGAGHENDFAGSSGGNGGGIVIIIADSIIGNGLIKANGENAKTSQNDGAGGGGAGGTVLLSVNHFEGNIVIDAKGGDGGNCNVGPYRHCYGPGGGGSGGLVWLKNNFIPDNITINIPGGINGKITNPNSPCYKSNYGAVSGEDGVVLFNLWINSCCDEASFNYPDFSSKEGLNLVGQAFQLQKSIVLTPSSQWDGGAVWHDKKIPVKLGFTTEFSFRFKNGVNKYEPETYEGADGITFVIQNDNSKALGAMGGGLGYSGIENSFAIEFDTYKNFQNNLMQTNLNDPSENHLGIFCNGTYPNESIHGGNADLFTLDLMDIMPIKTNGQIYYGKIEYNYENKELAIYLDTLEELESPLVVIPNIDLSKLLDLDTEEYAWVGFTSATGIVYEQHELLSWNFCSVPTSTKIIGVEDYEQAQSHAITIFPNPTSGIINISLPENISKNASVEVYNLLGERILIRELHSNNISLNLESYPTGTYCIKINTGSTVLSKMLIKD